MATKQPFLSENIHSDLFQFSRTQYFCCCCCIKIKLLSDGALCPRGELGEREVAEDGRGGRGGLQDCQSLLHERGFVGILIVLIAIFNCFDCKTVKACSMKEVLLEF